MPDQILLVDDDSDFRKEFKDYFSEYDIVDASDGDEALAILKHPNEISLVILDVKLPGASGTDLLIRIKEDSPDLRIVILTGFSSKSVAISALKGRADDYIEKPFDIEQMRETIERYIGTDGPAKTLPPAGFTRAKIEHVKKYLERNRGRRVSLDDAAKLVSLCPKYLSRAFKETVGVGFNDYRLTAQIGKAKELLTGGRHGVRQISEMLGYHNPESFIRQFKKMAGCTPTEYRSGKGQARKSGRR